MFVNMSYFRDMLIFELGKGLELKGLNAQILSPDENKKEPVCYDRNQGVLLRKCRPLNASVKDE